MSEHFNVVILCGSMAPRSYTHAALKVMERLLHRAGVQTRFVCVIDHPLPYFCATSESYPQEGKLIRQWIQSADGVVVGSPEYHGGCSGAIKNLIDHMDISDFQGKPIALICASGKKGGINTLNGLRLIFRALYAPVIVEQAIITKDDFDENQKLISRDALIHLLQVTEGLLREMRRSLAYSRSLGDNDVLNPVHEFEKAYER
jgi:azobenzene reductase